MISSNAGNVGGTRRETMFSLSWDCSWVDWAAIELFLFIPAPINSCCQQTWQKLPSREEGGSPARQLEGEKPFDILIGTWQEDPSGSTAWCHVEDGRPRFVYCYASSTPTGEYYGWERTGNALFGRFRWFEDKDIHGYGWFEVVGAERLKGGCTTMFRDALWTNYPMSPEWSLRNGTKSANRLAPKPRSF
jgi:hypothetical protein